MKISVVKTIEVPDGESRKEEQSMNWDINDMLRFLPKKITIAKTADLGLKNSEITMETIDIETIDVIHAFMELKKMAIKEAQKIKSEEKRIKTIRKIESMAFF